MTADRNVAAFRGHLAHGEFMVSRCSDCAEFSPPQAGICEHCASRELSWQPTCGDPSLISWAIDHSRGPVTNGAAVGIVAFAEGPWWWGRVRISPGAEPAVGLLLALTTEATDDGELIPVFCLGDDTSASSMEGEQ